MPKSAPLWELEQVLSRLIRKRNMEWTRKVERDISSSQALILECLQGSGKQKITELAEKLEITPGAITSLCDKMVAAHLIQRSRDEADRRVVYADITAHGNKSLDEVRQLRKEMVEFMYGNLSDEDIHHMIRIYNSVLVNMEQEKQMEKESEEEGEQ